MAAECFRSVGFALAASLPVFVGIGALYGAGVLAAGTALAAAVAAPIAALLTAA